MLFHGGKSDGTKRTTIGHHIEEFGVKPIRVELTDGRAATFRYLSLNDAEQLGELLETSEQGRAFTIAFLNHQLQGGQHTLLPVEQWPEDDLVRSATAFAASLAGFDRTLSDTEEPVVAFRAAAQAYQDEQIAAMRPMVTQLSSSLIKQARQTAAFHDEVTQSIRQRTGAEIRKLPELVLGFDQSYMDALLGLQEQTTTLRALTIFHPPGYRR